MESEDNDGVNCSSCFVAAGLPVLAPLLRSEWVSRSPQKDQLRIFVHPSADHHPGLTSIVLQGINFDFSSMLRHAIRNLGFQHWANLVSAWIFRRLEVTYIPDMNHHIIIHSNPCHQLSQNIAHEKYFSSNLHLRQLCSLECLPEDF